MGNTIFNNLSNEIKSIIISVCESKYNNCNDNIINETRIQKFYQ